MEKYLTFRLRIVLIFDQVYSKVYVLPSPPRSFSTFSLSFGALKKRRPSSIFFLLKVEDHFI